MKIPNVEIRQDGLNLEIDRQQFAIALKTFRLRHDLTQKQLGERWGVTRFVILNAEKGKGCSWAHAYKLFAKLSNELEKEADKSLEI